MTAPSTTHPDSGAEDAGPLVFRRTAGRSIGVIVAYVLLMMLCGWVYLAGSSELTSAVVALGLGGVLLVYLARYLSTRYSIDDRRLVAWRLFGSRRVRLSRIRRIQRANLRSLGPVGMIGTWGWRGRVWSGVVGSFDTVHTVSDGLLVSAGRVPVFISPVDPEEFQRELSRRVRSVNGGVEPDTEPI